MANTWIAPTAKKWSAAASWSEAASPTSLIDAIFGGTFVGEAKVEAEALCRSLIMTGYTGTLNLSIGNLVIGGSTAQAENIAFKAAGTMIGGQQLKFASTFTAVAQAIFTSGKTLPWQVKFSATGKWILEEAFRLSGSSAKINLEAGELLANGKTIEIKEGGLNATGSASLDLSGATLIGLGIGEGFNWGSTGAIVTSAGTIIEVGSATRAASQFGGGGRTYKGVVRLIGREVIVDSISGQTWETVEVLNKGATEKGQKWKAGAKSIFSSLIFNGTEAERCRIETSKAAEPHKIEHVAGDYEPANSFVAVKDIIFEGGTLYLPHGFDLGGNTNIVFGPKPSGARPLAMMV